MSTIPLQAPLQEHFDDFVATAFNQSCQDPETLRIMEVSFYAGALVLYSAIKDAGDHPSEEVLPLIEAKRLELQNYARKIANSLNQIQ